MHSFGNRVLFSLLCTLVFSEAKDGRNSLFNGVQYGKNCVWSTVGGNLTSAKRACNQDGGAIFTFNKTSDAVAILDKLIIAYSTPVFIGAIRIHDNGSLFFDWLSRPETWSPDLLVNVTAEEEYGYHDDIICIKLQFKMLSLTNCSEILSTTVCEKNDIQDCTSLGVSVLSMGPSEGRDPVQFGVDTGAQPKETTQNNTAAHSPQLSTEKTASGVAENDILKTTNLVCKNPSNIQNCHWTTRAGNTQHGGIVTSEQTTRSTSTSDLDSKGGELMIVPSENGIRITNFSSLLSEIFEKSNISKPPDTTLAPPSPVVIAGPNLPGSSTNQHFNKTNGTPVREVQFQVANKDKIFPGGVKVSGLNSGSIQPYSPLLIDQHVYRSAQLVNTSRILKILKHEKHADNITLKMFADTVQATADDKHISGETDDLKKDLFSDIMCVGENLVQKIPVTVQEITVTTEKIVLFSKIIEPDLGDSKKFLEIDHPHIDTHIQLSKFIFENDDGADVRVSTIAYKKMGEFLKASNKHLSSSVISVTVQYIKGNITETREMSKETGRVIKFTMKTKINREKEEDKRVCTFWDFSERKWSSAGCKVADTNMSHTICECDHLTNFAILVMYIETENISLQSQQALFTLTTVGCSLSIACLAMALICYVYLKMLSKEKIMIHANLSIALLLGQIVFVASGDAHRDPIACKIVAVLLHFLYMASFTWMMVEGIALYLCCTKGIFHHHDMRVKYFLFGWGLPLVIVVISLAARFPDYGSGPQYSCWLSINHGLIWAFLGPMLVIVVLNIGVMGLVIKCFLTLQANSEKSEAARLRGSLRAMMTLLPLLGVTWILSLLVPFSVVFHYFFVIFNTLQGMCIFFLHCICNEEIRKKFYEKRRRWSTTRTGSDAEMNFPSRRKTGSFDAIRAAAAATPVPAEYANRTAWT